MGRVVISRATRYGGTITFLFNLIEFLKLNSNDYLVLDPGIENNILMEIKNSNNCTLIFFPEYRGKLIIKRLLQNAFLFKLLLKIKKEKTAENINIYFADWNIVLDYLTLFLSNRSFCFVHTYPNKKLPYIIKIINTKFADKTSVVTVSNYSKDRIIESWFTENVPIGVLYNYSSLQGSDILGKDDDVFNCVTLAHCEIYKNPELWYQVAKVIVNRHNNVHFHWYGDGSLYEVYKNKSQENTNIHFHGYENDVAKVLESSQLYVQFSKIESLGISILDAMNHSLPCVVTNIGGMPELVQNGVNGFVCSNKEELINKIECLITDKSMYEQFSVSSKQIYNDNFSYNNWEKNMDKILVER